MWQKSCDSKKENYMIWQKQKDMLELFPHDVCELFFAIRKHLIARYLYKSLLQRRNNNSGLV